ncbi:MAG: phosphotransferase [Gammaproteobacteria bacterium]|nr:phosphotransferase [Gammaproteobacteria bacterium]
MPQRLEAIRRWLTQELGYREYALEPASTDASFRRYFRVTRDGDSRIVMDAPPDKEDSRPFVDIARRLREAGLSAPEVLASDLDRGFLLLTDLGDRLYLAELGDDTREPLYGDAMAALALMQSRVGTSGLPAYDEKLLIFELSLFPDWFLSRHLGLSLSDADRSVLTTAFQRLAANALAQPRVFVHRDYHSRNLMVLPEGNPGILDFQGAVEGPITYDLVSLLRDCYVSWSEMDVQRWLADFMDRLRGEGSLETVDHATFRRWFDWMGLQRHLKAIGIFARLQHRDGKPGYLADIPRTLDYVLGVTGRYRELADLHGRLEGWHLKERHLETLRSTETDRVKHGNSEIG